MQVGDPAFQERFVAALHEDEEFVLETRWFDGSILVDAGGQRCWVKIYRGKVIDVLDHVPAFGYTFKIAGTAEAWELLATGERTFTDLATPGCRHLDSVEAIEPEGGGYRAPELLIEGNQFEAGRVHVAILRLSNVFAKTAAGDLVAA